MTKPTIVVAVPVRNEAERLPGLLQALARQGDAPAFTLALFFDACDDGSEALVRGLAPALPFPIVSDGQHGGGPSGAGFARRRVMALARTIAPDGVLMTTDADSRPADDWIASNLAGLAAADIVAGRIRHDGAGASPLQARLTAYYDRLHALRRRIDPVPYEAAETHHWTSAASLAMRTVVHDRAGGFPARANGEDAAFADRAMRMGYTIRRDAAACVMTSARRSGRASGGFAAHLATLDTAGTLPTVAHPADEAWRYTMQGEARRAHGTLTYDTLAERLRLPLDEVCTVGAECVNGEAFAARIVGTPPGGLRQLPLPHAELLLPALDHGNLKGAA